MISPTPALKPVRTGSEMKLATTPRRRTEASTSMIPTRKASVAEATSSAGRVGRRDDQGELGPG